MPWEAPGHPLLTTLQRQAAKALASLQQAIMRREQELAELQAEAARWKSVMREQSGVSRPAAPTAHPRAARASRLDWRAVLQELPTTFSARDVAQKTQKPLKQVYVRVGRWRRNNKIRKVTDGYQKVTAPTSSRSEKRTGRP
jgi:hypothetical protein